MKSILEKITQSNFKQLAQQVAEEVFPKGTLVNWDYAGGIYFGIVNSISSTGKIRIQNGTLPIKKITDATIGGTFARYWYTAKKDSFRPVTKEDISYPETASSVFNPRYFIDDWKEQKYFSPIDWTQTKGNRTLTMSKPTIKNGLIMYESYCP